MLEQLMENRLCVCMKDTPSLKLLLLSTVYKLIACFSSHFFLYIYNDCFCISRRFTNLTFTVFFDEE